jgi:hypothetical protein
MVGGKGDEGQSNLTVSLPPSSSLTVRLPPSTGLWLAWVEACEGSLYTEALPLLVLDDEELVEEVNR